MRIDLLKLDSDRITDDDRARILAGTCFHLTGYGMPWMRWCEKPLDRDEIEAGHIECAEHEADILDEYGYVVRLREEDRHRVQRTAG